MMIESRAAAYVTAMVVRTDTRLSRLILGIGAVVVVVMLSGCSSSESGSADTTTQVLDDLYVNDPGVCDDISRIFPTPQSRVSADDFIRAMGEFAALDYLPNSVREATSTLVDLVRASDRSKEALTQVAMSKNGNNALAVIAAFSYENRCIASTTSTSANGG